MKVIDDTLKENGKWSKSALMIFVTFWANIVYAGWCVWKTTVFVDLPTNWLGLIAFLYGMNKGINAVLMSKSIPGTTTTNTSTSTKVTAEVKDALDNGGQ
jgi:hypothetical protein